MNENKREGVFIPCGDSLEKMEEISEKELGRVSDGSEGQFDYNKDEVMLIIPDV